MTITFDLELCDVFSVYSGKAGKCCCGCAGKHTYVAASRVAAGKDRGYAIDDDEVSDRSVKTILSKMKAIIETNDAGLGDVKVDIAGSYVSVEANGRLWVAYRRTPR